MNLDETGIAMENKQNRYGVVLFETAHDAIIGEKKIRDYLDVVLMPIPSQFSAGCGIVLRFEPYDEERIRELLASNRIQGRIEFVRGSEDGGKPHMMVHQEGDKSNE